MSEALAISKVVLAARPEYLHAKSYLSAARDHCQSF